MKERVYEHHQKKQRQAILDVTEDLFCRYGIEQVSTSMIAKACGLSRPTIYHYFPKKEDIYLTLIRAYTMQIYETTLSACAAATCTYQRFEIFAETLSSFLLENKKASTLQLSVAQIYPQNELEKTDEEPNKMVLYLMDQFHDGSVRADLDPLQTSLNFLYAIESTVLTFFRMQDNIQKRYQCDIAPLVALCIASQLAFIKAV